MSNAVAFNQQMIKQFTPMINKIINDIIKNDWHPDNYYTKEDIFQECLEHLWKATLKFDPDRGMKFSSYVYLVMQSRVGSLRNKLNRKTRTPVFYLADKKIGEDFLGRGDDNSDKQYGTNEFESNITALKASTDALDEIIDAKTLLANFKDTQAGYYDQIRHSIKERLANIDNKECRRNLITHYKTKRKSINQVKQQELLFCEYYLKGKKVREICEDNPTLKPNQVRNCLKHIEPIYKTLIQGQA